MFARYLCLLTVLSFYTVGCSIDTQPCDKVDQDSIYQSLIATYDKQSDETGASATLRFGGATGTTLELVGNCDLEHNLFELTKAMLSDLFGTSYRGSTGGEHLSHTFTFTDNDNQSYTNSVAFTAIDFAATIPTISKSAGIVISWTGGALGSDETVYFNLEDNSGESTLTAVKTTSTVGATSITVPSSFFDAVSTGTGKMIWLMRAKSKSLSQGTSEGGRISGTYYSLRQTVEITN